MNNTQKGILLTLISTVLNSSTYILTKHILKTTNVETMLIWWFLWASIIFVAFFIFKGILKKILKELGKNRKVLIIFGIINSIGILLWTYAILYGNTTSIAFIFRMEAVFAVILGLTILKERLGMWEWTGIGMAIIGAFIMVYNHGIVMDKATIAMLISALTSAFTIFMAKVYVKKISPYSLTFTRAFSTLIFISIFALALGKVQFVIQPNVIGLTFLAATVGAFLGFFFFFKSLSFYKLSKATAIRSTEPFFVALLGFVILMEIPTINQIVGGMLIVSGVVILSLMGKNKNGNAKNTKAK